MAKPVDTAEEVRRSHEAAVRGSVNKTPKRLPPARPTLFSIPLLPLDTAKVMADVARVSGVTVAALGAALTLFVASQTMPGSVSELRGVQNTAQLISETTTTQSMSTSDTTAGTVQFTETVVQQVVEEPIINSVLNAQQSFMRLSMQPPLRGRVEVRVHTPQAHAVEIYLFTESWQNKQRLGNARQVETGVWVYSWDTTTVESGLNYRLSAGIWDASDVNLPENFTVQLNYMLVDNATAPQPTPVPTAETPTVREPAVEIRSAATLSGEAAVTVAVPGALGVVLQLEHVPSGSRNSLYTGVQVAPGEWRFRWPTLQYQNGEYRLRARVTNSFGSYTAGDRVVAVANTAALAPAPVAPNQTVTTTVTTTIAPVTQAILPTIRIRLSDRAVLEGTERIEVDTTGSGIQSVFFYIRDAASTFPRYIGAAQQGSGTRWSMNWFTGNTPNGTYTLFALASTPVGQIESQRLTVNVANDVAAVTAETPPLTVNEDLAEVAETMTAPVSRQTSAPDETADEDSTAAEAAVLTEPEEIAEQLIAEYRERFDDALMRLGTAYRTGDTDAQSRIRERITALIGDIVSASPYRDRTEIRGVLTSRVDALIGSYTADVSRVDSILTERQRSDITRDTDADGIPDFDEVAIYKTDPLRADTDGDGFTDGAEILSGFDPLSDARESVITYESPKETGVFREDILKVASVEALPIPVRQASDATTTTPTLPVATSTIGLKITGTALPNSFATLYIFSTPIIVTVKTNEEGAFEYRFEKELEDGEHNVYVGITDNAGRVVAKSQPLRFIKEAQAITPAEAATLDAALTPAPEADLLSNRFMTLVVAISIVAIGVILIMLGMHLDARRRRSVVSVDGIASS